MPLPTDLPIRLFSDSKGKSMLLINQLKFRPGYTNDDIRKKIASALKTVPDDIIDFRTERRSIDARKKPEVFYVLSVSVNVKHEELVIKRINNPDICVYSPDNYDFVPTGKSKLLYRPVVVGAGPCGLFTALYLAEAGYKPIVLERGYDVDSRTVDVNEFWNGGILRKNSNVLFGEGGAGTFSDGKLNTLVKDKCGRNKEVLRRFVEFGADLSVLTDAKPHVGTDVLKTIVKAIRERIKSLGGEFRFNAELTDIVFENEAVKSIKINGLIDLPCNVLVLCIGHSARDTFQMLYDKGISLEQKDFAVGFRVEHKQSMINSELYGNDCPSIDILPPASYKLTYKAKSGRGVYSFCMCPGGYVVNASSEPGRLCINGMSYSKRDGENANSAIVVTVDSKDFNSDHPLAGIEFQRRIEEAAYNVGNGSIPVQRFGDFKADLDDSYNMDEVELYSFENVEPQIKGSYTIGKLKNILPDELNHAIVEGMEHFDKIIPGFADNMTLLSAVESRTSSPVRILRDEKTMESIGYSGLYPCGEGAGYAGGITSAAMDGIKVYEKIAAKYQPLGKEQ